MRASEDWTQHSAPAAPEGSVASEQQLAREAVRFSWREAAARQVVRKDVAQLFLPKLAKPDDNCICHEREPQPEVDAIFEPGGL